MIRGLIGVCGIVLLGMSDGRAAAADKTSFVVRASASYFAWI